MRRWPILVILLLLLILAIAAGAWLLPRLLGADEEAIANVMPEETAVFAEINLLNLQNAASRQVAAAFAGVITAADVPFNSNDPTTAFNIFDPALQQLIGLTVSEDVRPWVGMNVGLGLLPPGEDGQARWLLAATVREGSNAEEFISQVEMTAVNGATAVQVGDLVLIASDPATLAAATAAQEGLSLADSKRFQEALAQLPEERAATIYLNGADLNAFLATAVPESSAGVVEAIRGVLPTYTAVGMAAYVTEQGIQVDMVGLHAELSEVHQALLAAQTANPERLRADTPTAALLPEGTAVYLTGQRADLLWQLLKGSLDGLGYSEADVDEAMELFAGLFGFNPETELLATLDGDYAVALLPAAEGTIGPGLSVVALVEHSDPTTLAQQAESFTAGLELLGVTAVNTNSVHQLSDPDGQPIAAYAIPDGYLLVGTDVAGVTAVTQATSHLNEKPSYQDAWASLPDGTIPVLFVDTGQLAGLLPTGTATNPITQAVFSTYSHEAMSRGTLILEIGGLGD
jgi:hypothetical protein